MGVDEFAGEVVASIVTPRRSELAAVSPVRQHLPSNLGLFRCGGFAPRKRFAIAAPVLEHFIVFLGKADEPKDRLTGQREGELLDELGG